MGLVSRMETRGLSPLRCECHSLPLSGDAAEQRGGAAAAAAAATAVAVAPAASSTSDDQQEVAIDATTVPR